MSAEVTSWKLTLPCTRAEAEAIDAGAIDIDAVLMTTEEVEDDGERWRLDAYTDAEPDAAMIAAIRALVPSAAEAEPLVEPLTDQDWVAMSQAGLEPIREGRFVVHTSAHPVEAAEGSRAFLIDAGQAFGTGHHFTTAGCLAVLDLLARDGARFERAIDLGTGTGLLAFAARHLWPDARITATDIDPIAIDVTRENMAANDMDGIELIVADGARHPAIDAGSPYDLVIANILAGPLIAMAPEIAAVTAPGAQIVLAGLLNSQRQGVVDAYADQGCGLEQVEERGDWSILRLVRGMATGCRAAPATGANRAAWRTDGR